MSKKNLVILEGGLTRDPEEFESANIVHLSLAVDNAGQEKGVQYASGYFDVKVWLNDSKYTPAITAETVRAALDNKSLKKGTKIAITGQLKQERWERDGKKSSKVVVVADTIEIYTAKPASNAQPAMAASSVNDEEETFVPSF